MIGIFWLYNNNIYLKSINIDSLKAIENFIDSNFAHYQVWDEISSQHKDFYLYEYEDIPRGRVVYDIANMQYIVYANNKTISSHESKTLIINAFILQRDKVVFLYDEHYEIKSSIL